MTVADHRNRRAEAWELGAQGYYDAALDILESLLKEAPADLVSLRMKGNLLELKTLEVMEHSRKRLTSSADYLAARDCYKKILEIDPHNVRAHIDLGDHYKNLDANDKSLEHYEQAIDLLQRAPRDSDWNEDAEELLKAISLLTRHERLAAEAALLEKRCKTLLDIVD